MAERRMFARTITQSDAFCDMPPTARLLYYELNLNADDDGFINAPKKIARSIGSSEDDMRILFSKKFVIPFESGVVVIKHWRIHNLIQKDRYRETKYKEELALLDLDENNAYRERREIEPDTDTSCIQPVYKPLPQVRLGKDRLGKEREEIVPPKLQEITDYIITKQLVINPNDFLTYYENTGWKDRDGNPVKNWKNKLIQWNKREVEKRPGAKPYSTPVRQAQGVARCSCGGDISYGLCKACGKMYDGLGVEL